MFLIDKDRFIAAIAEQHEKAEQSGKRLRRVDLERIPREIETFKAFCSTYRGTSSRKGKLAVEAKVVQSSHL